MSIPKIPLANGLNLPGYVRAVLILLCLFVDDKTYFISNGDCKGNSGIYLCEINPFTGEMLTESTLISTGCGGKYPEAPHLYYINHEFYLMLAEGGTEYGHMVTMQKSTSPWGPFTPCPYNPILTNRNLPNGSDIIACTGHADLIDDIRGNWWMVALGVRTICTEGKNVLLHNLGRETYLTPVTWKKWISYGRKQWSFADEYPYITS